MKRLASSTPVEMIAIAPLVVMFALAPLLAKFAAAPLLAQGAPVKAPVPAPSKAAATASAAAPTAGAKATPPRPASAAEPVIGSFVSSKLNNKPLPVTDLASDDVGVQYLIEFDELILSIRPGHEFRAALRYRQTLAAKGERIGRDPIQKMTVYGTWTAVGSALRFVPDPKRGGQGLRILDGTFGSNSISVPFDYRNGTVQRRANVVLMYNPNIF